MTAGPRGRVGRRGRCSALLPLAAAALGLGWFCFWFSHERADAERANAERVDATPVAATVWPRPALPLSPAASAPLLALDSEALSSAASAVPPRLRRPPASLPASAPEWRSDWLEVCGMGWVQVEEPPPGVRLEDRRERPRADWERRMEAEIEALRERLSQHLRSSSEPFELQLGLQLGREYSAAAEQARLSAEPSVYRLALQACQQPGAGPRTASCEQLSAQRWAQLEPDNAVPWLLLGQEALSRGDRSGLEQALFQAALARRLIPAQGLLSTALAERLPADAEPLARGGLLLELMGREFAGALQGINLVPLVCTAQTLRDANRRQVCGGLARLLLGQGRSLMELGLGLAVAERLGLPESELPATRAQLEAALRQQEQINPPEELLSCQGLRRLEDWVRELGRVGEWRALQARQRAAEGALPR
jgi:hypothetical protein